MYTEASANNKIKMFKPATEYLKEYRECSKRTEMRKSISSPINEEEDYQFCKKYYKLYIAKLVSDLI